MNIEFAANQQSNGCSETRVFLQHLRRLLLNDKRAEHRQMHKTKSAEAVDLNA